MDGTLKLWDLRSFKKPLGAWDNLPANYPTTNVVFSPDERLLLTGTAAGENGKGTCFDQAEAGTGCHNNLPAVSFITVLQLRVNEQDTAGQ